MNEKLFILPVIKSQLVKMFRVRIIYPATIAIYENRRDTLLDDVDDICMNSPKRVFFVFYDKVAK